MDEMLGSGNAALQETDRRIVMDVRDITKSLPLGREMNYIWNSICLGRASDEKRFPAQGRSDCHFATQRTIVARSPCTASVIGTSNRRQAPHRDPDVEGQPLARVGLQRVPQIEVRNRLPKN